MNPVDSLDNEFAAIREYWAPRVVAAVNGQYLKLAKVKGEFVWHAHAAEDELFLVHRGLLRIRYRDGREAVLKAGDFHVVPRGVEHCPYAPEEAWLILFEPAGTAHTGGVETPLTRAVADQMAHLD